MLMNAIMFQQFGGPEVLRWTAVPKPSAKDNQVLIKVKSAGVNPIDAKIRDGSSFVSESLKLSSCLGFDVCGEVVEVGSNVHQFKNGDIVLGGVGRYDRPCAYAEYALANADDLIIKPEALDPIPAGAMTMIALTAWQAVHEYGKVMPKERVLIHAGAGGVGHLAIQYAKIIGAEVVTTASAHDEDYLRRIGADQVIDYQNESFENILTDIDLVIDLIGGPVGLNSLKILKKGGRLVTVPTITRDEVLAEARKFDVQATGMIMEGNIKNLKKLATLIADGKVHLNVSKTFPMKDAALAHEKLKKSHRGKIILVNN